LTRICGPRKIEALAMRSRPKVEAEFDVESQCESIEKRSCWLP
jgi:hypothetical protein